jgi:GntR family transcriptional repressor for pyruvate dehydrogenase complex
MAAADDTTEAPEPVRRRRVQQLRIAETIAAELRRRILGPGEEIYDLPTQEVLVQEFGVSYPSVREAVRILETEGLVTVRRGKAGGLDAHRPDEASAAYHLGLVLQGKRVTLRDLADALQALEPLCAADCARRPDRHETLVPALRENIERSAALVAEDVAFTHTCREFHDLVVAATPNTTVSYVVRSLVALWSAQEEAWAAARARRGTYPSAPEAEDVLRAHRRLLEEIEAGRPDEAERVARAHVAATQALVLGDGEDVVVDATFARWTTGRSPADTRP